MEIVMPQLGETVTEGTVITWHKKVGDAVKADEPLFEVETEKVTTDIPSPIAGVLASILVEAGTTVAVGTKLAVVDAAAAAAPPAPKPAAAEVPREASAPSATVTLNKIRRQTATHMARSVATSPHVLQAIEVDFDAIDRVRSERGAAWKTREGFALTYLPFVARAVCDAIAEFPCVNASFADDTLTVHKHVHLGIAVDLNFEGLIVPVVRDAGRRDLAALAREINRLVAAARSGALMPDETTGGTYTLSNSGAFGTFITAPIIHQPQVAILSIDGVHRKPAVVNVAGAETIAIRPIGVLAQSFDHRAFDGAYSAAYLKRLKETLEARDWRGDLA